MEDTSNTTPLEQPVVATTTTEPVPAVPEPKPEPPKKYSKRVIEMVGLESCGGCQETTEFIETQLKPNSDVEVVFNKHDVESERGKEIVKNKNLKYVPWIKECLIPTDANAQPECKEVNSYDKKFFKVKVNE